MWRHLGGVSQSSVSLAQGCSEKCREKRWFPSLSSNLSPYQSYCVTRMWTHPRGGRRTGRSSPLVSLRARPPACGFQIPDSTRRYLAVVIDRHVPNSLHQNSSPPPLVATLAEFAFFAELISTLAAAQRLGDNLFFFFFFSLSLFFRCWLNFFVNHHPSPIPPPVAIHIFLDRALLFSHCLI